MTPPPAVDASRQQAVGLAYTTGAFLLWGLSPIFWKLVVQVPASQLLAHRVVWCALLMVVVLAIQRSWGAFGLLLRRPRTLALLVLSTALIGANWFLYIWAVTTGHILQASLGYFVNPLINVLLGLLFLGERLRRLQWTSVALATLGVVILTVQLGELPWVSLALAVTFGFYGLLRKTLAATPEQGLTLETWLLVPVALIFLVLQHRQGLGAMGHLGWGTDVLLVATGAMTAVPLLWFTHGARRLPLSTVGILQYLAPTCQFLLAVLVYREPFDRVQLLAFAFIWAALGIFSLDTRRHGLRSR